MRDGPWLRSVERWQRGAAARRDMQLEPLA
jgi:hypothetical protein